MLPIKVICFYTPNTPYQQEVEELKTSCVNFEIPLEVEPLESKGSWEKNVAMKPQFILRKLKETKVPLLWVDADAVFLQKPDFSLFEDIDFSVRFMEVFQGDRAHAINAATIFVNQTLEAYNLVQTWVGRCEYLATREDPPISVDQVALYDILLENRTAKVLPLPISYCKIYDLDTFFINDEQVVIEQRQASRRYK